MQLHPMMGTQPFKLGIFCANCSGGLAISTAAERWKADWDDVVELTLQAERAGLDFILPVAKWRGYGGEANTLGRSFETLTHGAALAALTERIGIFATVHVPIVAPAFAAKALATIDHVSHGRAGLNIVCGWNQEEFDLFGVEVDPAHRYDQGFEWYQILTKLFEGGPEFDWDGEFYQLTRLQTDPLPVQRPRPVTMSAGFSPAGREFAAKAADFLFTTMTELEQGSSVIKDIHTLAARHGREIGICTMSHVVCRESRDEAEAYYYRFAEELADRAALDYYKTQKGIASTDDDRYVDRPLATCFTRATGKSYAGSYPGAYPLVGTPQDVAEELVRMHALGLAGTTVSFLDYLAEFPLFAQRVLPLLADAGIREPAASG